MQFLGINPTTTMADLVARVGAKVVPTVLQQNSLPRTHAIGAAFTGIATKYIEDYKEVSVDGIVSNVVSYGKKKNILNTLTSDADVFEAAALQSDDGWKVLASMNTIPGYLRLPDIVTLPDSSDILGSSTPNPVNKRVYNRAIGYLENNMDIDPVIFNTYSDIHSTPVSGRQSTPEVFQWFHIPWGEIILYSSLDDSYVEFPVYPEVYDDERHANYDTMPDLLYQYEPWQVYKSSGPRNISYTFKMHRDMWTGDHKDGKCNELIRFCQAQCYPYFNGATVHTSTVALYVAGKTLISGIMTSVKTNYSGPIGHDGFPLYVELVLSITEVSEEPLNYYSVKRKELIG